MFNSTEIVIDAFVEYLQETYLHNFSNMEPSHPGILGWCARMALERISDTDALYHDVEHTILVTVVGQDILKGKHIKDGGVTPDDWLHFVVSLLCHDIGYVRGVCRGDTDTEFVINDKGDRVKPPPGASDAFLTPHHVERGKIFVRERLGEASKVLDADRIIAGLELTRFPVPDASDHPDTKGSAGLVRAADLIGQLADPNYMRKINCLFYEFVETGAAEKFGFETPADLAEGYPAFFWGIGLSLYQGCSQVSPGDPEWKTDGRQPLWSHLRGRASRTPAWPATELIPTTRQG